jgi:hypothetical protein
VAGREAARCSADGKLGGDSQLAGRWCDQRDRPRRLDCAAFCCARGPLGCAQDAAVSRPLRVADARFICRWWRHCWLTKATPRFAPQKGNSLCTALRSVATIKLVSALREPLMCSTCPHSVFVRWPAWSCVGEGPRGCRRAALYDPRRRRECAGAIQGGVPFWLTRTFQY